MQDVAEAFSIGACGGDGKVGTGRGSHVAYVGGLTATLRVEDGSLGDDNEVIFGGLLE